MFAQPTPVYDEVSAHIRTDGGQSLVGDTSTAW
ncbi:hypothetical protein MHPYR_600018 [uncultured Mycobacterium sp.]|uniref:Uncharacterized protein n=1 Tax=uncultured Mycobacterium sp. TaxID=171292 RepID=A0A1Y5PJB4_9MYCO|nr:hypothetical protein MHPYR_600018 [uncultured Mycobacterium sp.]